MTDIFQIASVGMLDGKQRLEAISMNAASASLPGYRRQVVAASTFDAALAAADVGAAPNGSALTAPDAMVSTATRLPVSRQVDLKPGAMMATGRPLDVAIDAEDLFFALTDGTQTWLTRGGSFRVNDDGLLVGERGLRVVGTQGDVRLPSIDVTVQADGRITQEGATVATLQLFRPSDRTSLMPAQGALLATAAGVQPAEAGVGRVRGGTLEASNTDATREMLGLMALSRQFESLTHVVQGYDQVLGRAIQKLGEI